MAKIKFKDDGSQLRKRIFKVLRNSRTSAKKDLVVLLQCAAHIRNKLIIEETAKECNLKLSGFLTNDDLELYYDLKQGRHDAGYISKGWNDPGFRVGEIIEVSKPNIFTFKEKIYVLLRFCATRGVAFTIKERRNVVEVHMNSVIYSDGFNKKVFEQVLHELNVCVEKAHELIG
jgi:hypothetical protein